MKKILLFASAAALMASCAEMDLGTEGAQTSKLPAGISFVAGIDEGANTRAEWEYSSEGWSMFWYAEADKMDFYARNAEIGGTATAKSTEDWKVADVATYKATRSEKKGYFTADDNNKVIKPVKDGEEWLAPEFAYVWPTATAVKVVEHNLVATLPVLSTQDQTTIKGSSTIKNAFMTGTKKVDATQIKDYTSGSDMLIDIKLERKMPLLGFFFKGYDATTYGKLQSIKIESLGALKENGEPDGSKKSNLDYGTDATWNINESDNSKAYTAGSSTTAASVTLKIDGGSGIEWGNGRDFTAFMTVAPVDRSEMEFGEQLQITYAFENTDVVRKITVKNNWETGHHFYAKDISGADGFDLAAEPYIVFAKGATKTLQINSNFDKTLASLGENISGTVTTAFTKIVVNKSLTDADFTTLGSKFTGLTDITLNENTSIPAFETTATIAKLNAPKVAAIDTKAFEGATLNLTDCILPAYDFKNVTIANKLLTTANLKVLDISSVDVIATTFPASGLSLQGFTALIDVTVKSGVKVGTKAFDGCTNLKNVKFAGNVVGGSIDLTGTYAFNKCSAALTTIAIANTDIPDGTFNGCAGLTTILGANQKAIAPTTIGTEAFAGTKIADIDLSQTTAIGASAFKGCTALVGTHDNVKDINVLLADKIETLNKSTFDGCTNLQYVGFANVTKVNDDFLNGTKCKEISFGKVISYGGTATMTDASFGTKATLDQVTLYVAGGQSGIADATLTLGKQTFTFKAIK